MKTLCILILAAVLVFVYSSPVHDDGLTQLQVEDDTLVELPVSDVTEELGRVKRHGYRGGYGGFRGGYGGFRGGYGGYGGFRGGYGGYGYGK